MTENNRGDRYKGKVVLVTGSSRGIGKEITRHFASEGANVVVHYFRNGPQARQTVEEMQSYGAHTLLVKANMAEPEKIQQLFHAVEEEFGHLDVFVHNAASGRNRPVMEIDAKGWDWTMDVNARAYLLAAQEAARLMAKPGKGVMLSISSFGSTHVLPYYASVGASKAAMEALTRYLAVEFADRNININCISAGAVVTGALEHFPEIDKTWSVIEERLSPKRMVNATDVARLALFLASPEAEMICGQVIHIDGGATLKLP